MNLNLNKDEVAIVVAIEEELPKHLLPEFNVFYSGVGKINATYKSLEIINEFNPENNFDQRKSKILLLLGIKFLTPSAPDWQGMFNIKGLI